MLDYADHGRLREPTQMTLGEAGTHWLAMAESGEITNRSGRRYKPSALQNVEQDLRLRLVPDLGAHRLAEITRSDLQRRVGAWLAQGLSPSRGSRHRQRRPGRLSRLRPDYGDRQPADHRPHARAAAAALGRQARPHRLP